MIALDGHGGCVTVARWGSTTEDQLAAAVGDIQRSGTGLVGIVLTDVPTSERDWVAAGGTIGAESIAD